MTVPVDDLLDAARRAGLLVELDGGVAIAEPYREPGLGRNLWLLEYLTPALLDATDLAERIAAARARAGLPLMPALVRVPPARHPAGSRHFSHYLRTAGTPPPDPSDAAVTVRPAGPADTERLTGWLAAALNRAYGPAMADDRAAIAASLLADPDRRSWIAEKDGAPIGHATVSTACTDTLTGEDLVELLDVLVDDEAHRRAAQARLVVAAHRHASSLGRDLLGHVVCEPGQDTAHCGRVVAGLTQHGWRPAYDYVLIDDPAEGRHDG